MRFIITIDETKATETDLANLEYELFHVVRKYSDIATISREIISKK